MVAAISAVAVLIAVPESVLQAHGGRVRDACARKESVTLIQTRLVRVYRNKRTLSGASIFACHRPTGRATRLGSALGQTLFEYGGRRATAVRKSRVAYGLIVDPDSEEGGPTTLVVLARLPLRGAAFERAGRVRAVAGEPAGPNMDRAPAIERIVIAPNGTVAFTACPAEDVLHAALGCRRPPTDTRVIAATPDAFDSPKRPATAKPVELARDAQLDPRSLRLSPSGKRLAWTVHGRTQTAHVPSG